MGRGEGGEGGGGREGEGGREGKGGRGREGGEGGWSPLCEILNTPLVTIKI